MLVWGHMGNFPLIAERAAPWAHASTLLTVPSADRLDAADPADYFDFQPRRNALTPQDMLAVAFNGLARHRMRGAKKPGDDLTTFIENLRGLADALEAFNNYNPGAFFTTKEVRGIAQAKREADDPGAAPA
jgi:hypothetical protein